MGYGPTPIIGQPVAMTNQDDASRRWSADDPPGPPHGPSCGRGALPLPSTWISCNRQEPRHDDLL